MKKIYLDYASITPICPQVEKVIKKYGKIDYGNPSSIHSFGLQAKKELLRARKSIASFLHSHPDEIIFTASGTESNSLAFFGLYGRLVRAGKKPEELHLVTSQIEHASVLECAKELKRRGVEVDFISVSKEGEVDAEEIRKKIRQNTFLVSMMHV